MLQGGMLSATTKVHVRGRQCEHMTCHNGKLTRVLARNETIKWVVHITGIALRGHTRRTQNTTENIANIFLRLSLL